MAPIYMKDLAPQQYNALKHFILNTDVQLLLSQPSFNPNPNLN